MVKRTALYDRHVAAGGKLVQFAGYELPVQYTGIIAEHRCVRERAGLFDVSHMGEFLVTGKEALATVNNLLTNDFTDLQQGEARYSPMCYPNGGTVDDLLVYMMEPDKYLVVVNAANREKDFEWMNGHLIARSNITDVSDCISQVALQGPMAQKILAAARADRIPEKYYTFIEDCYIDGIPCLISRTGYTGEDGFEIYCGNGQAGVLWDRLLAAGAEHGIMPCGLGARDTLRLEAGMPLYGDELSESITPKEAGLGMFVKLNKDHFIGKKSLERDRQRKRVGLILRERGIARAGCAVFAGNYQIGVVTSGTVSPTLGGAIAMALISAAADVEDINVEVRGKRIPAEIVKMPFYKINK